MFVFFLFLNLLVTQEFESQSTSENVAEELQILKDNPISINTAKSKDLIFIYWITPELAKSIIKTRNKSGGFKKIDELKKVEGMTDEIFDLIKPYIKLEDTVIPSKFSLNLRQRIQGELPEETDTLGSPIKAYERLKIDYRNISSSVLLEKDYYEKSFYDLATGGIMIKNIGFIEFLIGDYNLDFAEGLLFGIPPLATFKSQGMIKGKSRGIKLNTSSGENTFMRGTALELKLNKTFKNYIFFANTTMDARVEDNEVKIYYDYEGDHSTTSGIEKNDRIKEELWGTRVEYSGFVKTGATFYKNSYYLNPEGNKIGIHNLLGMDLSGSYSGIEWFTELGRCDSIWALVAGAEYRKSKLKIGTLYRYYPPLFYVLHSSPWSDRTTTTSSLSEKGNYFYTGYQLSEKTLFTYYLDYFTWLPRTSTDDKKNGTEFLCEIQQKLTEKISVTGKYDYKELYESVNQKIRIQTDISTKILNLRLRFETVVEDTNSGNLGYVNIEFKGFRKLIFAGRIILFETKPLLYEYESDLPGMMTNLCLSSEGTRWYLFLKYKLSSNAAISAKYSTTSKTRLEATQKYGVQIDVRM